MILDKGVELGPIIGVRNRRANLKVPMTLPASLGRILTAAFPQAYTPALQTRTRGF